MYVPFSGGFSEQAEWVSVRGRSSEGTVKTPTRREKEEEVENGVWNQSLLPYKESMAFLSLQLSGLLSLIPASNLREQITRSPSV